MATEDELPTWVQQLIGRVLSPAEVAAGDQIITAGKKAAADLLTSYMGYCVAMDSEDQDAALLHHLKFQVVFSRLSKSEAVCAMALVCDLLVQELRNRHGSFDGVIAAAMSGSLFNTDDDPDRDWENELLRRLEGQ
jgi:hypothetical protein